MKKTNEEGAANTDMVQDGVMYWQPGGDEPHVWLQLLTVLANLSFFSPRLGLVLCQHQEFGRCLSSKSLWKKKKKEKEPDSVGTIERNKPLKYSGKGQWR